MLDLPIGAIPADDILLAVSRMELIWSKRKGTNTMKKLCFVFASVAACLSSTTLSFSFPAELFALASRGAT
jgi:hypothetical protein